MLRVNPPHTCGSPRREAGPLRPLSASVSCQRSTRLVGLLITAFYYIYAA